MCARHECLNIFQSVTSNFSLAILKTMYGEVGELNGCSSFVSCVEYAGGIARVASMCKGITFYQIVTLESLLNIGKPQVLE